MHSGGNRRWVPLALSLLWLLLVVVVVVVVVVLGVNEPTLIIGQLHDDVI